MDPNATMGYGSEPADMMTFLTIMMAIVTMMMNPIIFNNIIFRKPRGKVVVDDVVCKVEEEVVEVEVQTVYLYQVIKLTRSEEEVSCFVTTVEVDDLPLDTALSLELISSQDHADHIHTTSPPPSSKPRQRLTPPPSDRVLRSQIPRAKSFPTSSKSTSPSPSTAGNAATEKHSVRARSAPQQPGPNTGQAAGSASSKRLSSKKAKA